MKKILSFCFLFLMFSTSVFSQNITFETADILFEKQEYSAAQNQYLKLAEQGVETDLVVYRIANCSKNLNNKDAIFWYDLFIKEYNYSDLYQLAIVDLSYIYFNEKNYSKSSQLLNKVTDNKLKDDEFHFKIGYSLFSIKKLDDAKYHLQKVTVGEFGSLSMYYYAHISYLQKLYNKSLSTFRLLENDKVFGKIAPYYITQIYFSLEKYKDVIEYSLPVLESVISTREVEMNRIIAESYYQLSDYKNSEIYFKNYIELSEDIKMSDYFQLGQINVFLEDYSEAIIYFEKVQNVSDSLIQYNSYYLGKSYLMTNQKNFALNAFEKAGSINSDLQLKEESLYNYFKLAYELDLPYTNLTFVLEEFSRFHLSKYKSEVKRLLINMFQSTNQYQQAFDFLKNNHLPEKEEKVTLQRLSYYIGVQHYNNANYNNALVKFEFARSYPENKEIDVMCLYLLADCYYQLRDYTRSVNYYSEYISTPSNSLVNKIGIAKYNLAYSYFQSKKYEKSVSYFRKAINSELDKERLNDANLRLADSYYMLHKFKNAVRYYDNSETSHLDEDYAMYQKSKCYALLSDYKKQENCLLLVVNDSTNTIYLERSLFDLANLYKNQDKDDQSISYFDLILNLSSDQEILSQSLLNKGLIYFNQNNLEKSIENLKELIESYPKTTAFKGAKIGLRDAFVKKGDIKEYLDYINKIPQLEISVASKDSLSYEVSFNNFQKEDYELSKNNFFNYLTQFGEDAIFDKQSHYYYAESCWKTNDTLNAISSFKKVLTFDVSVFYEPSLVRICRYSYDANDVVSSNKYYQILDVMASSDGLKRESITRLMFGMENSDEDQSVHYAERLLSLDKLDNRLIARAKIIIARSDFNNGNYARSSDLCDEIVKLTTNRDGSEAMYMKSYFTFLEDDYQQCEKLIFEMSDRYSSNFWIAKSFILLSDIYVKQDNNYQAKATLESIIENSDNEDIVNKAKLKWELIVEQEHLKNSVVVEEEVSIEIGDSVDYIINYSDLQIEEEF